MHQNGLHNQIRSKENLTFLLPCFYGQLTGSSLTPRQDLGHIFSFVIHFVYLGNTGPESRKSPDNWPAALAVWEVPYLTSRPYRRSEGLWTTLLYKYDNCDDDDDDDANFI